MFWSGCSWDNPGNVPGTNRVCSWDKPTLSQGQSQVLALFTEWKPSLLQGETQFVPGTIPGTKGGRKSLCVRSLSAFFARSKPRWTFRIFFIFFCSGEGKGESEVAGGGGGPIFIEKCQEGGGSLGRGGGGGGAGRVSAGNLGGGGLNIFFRARNSHQAIYSPILTYRSSQNYYRQSCYC